ncbi:hypothetical protein [Pseudomonas sp. UMAB-08]|uniref:hypothetical protein n=1 Tax=Pseudomonas sp. UMAB-08 TaxID=1365375 RepID=UPI001C591AC9|nr:hypothetical protein [Pseudomonas sp. UMAB-08]
MPIVIPLTTGTDTLTGTSSNDTFTSIGSTLNSGDRIIGGGGSDELRLSGGGTFDLSGVTLTNVQKITLVTTATNTLNVTNAALVNVTSINGSSGTDTMTTSEASLDLSRTSVTNWERITTTNTTGTSFIIGAGSQLVFGASGNDTFHLSTQPGSNKSIDGSTGTNTLALDSANTYDLTAMSSFTNVQNVTGSIGNDTLIVDATMLNGFASVDLGLGSNTLQSNSTTFDISAKTMTNVQALNNTSASTTFTLSSAQLASNGGWLTYITGFGTGNNVTTSGTNLDMSSTSLSNIQQLLSTSTVGTNFKIGTTGGSALTLTGGAGADTFHLTAAQMAAASTLSINGGSGTNSLVLDTGGRRR